MVRLPGTMTRLRSGLWSSPSRRGRRRAPAWRSPRRRRHPPSPRPRRSRFRASRRSSARTTPSTSTRSRCATECGCTPRSTCPRTRAAPTPSCCSALPTARRPTGPTPIARPWGLRSASRATASSSSTRTCAVAISRRASSSRRHRIVPARAASRSVDESTDAWDTIEWLVANVPNNNGRVGMWGISYPGFYAAAGMIDAHPALEAVSPQAPIGDLFMGDDCYHNGAFMLAANFDFFTAFVAWGRPGRPVEQPEFDYGTTDGYRYFLEMGPLENSRKVLGDHAVLARPARAHHLRRVLEEPRHHAASRARARPPCSPWVDGSTPRTWRGRWRSIDRSKRRTPAWTIIW